MFVRLCLCVNLHPFVDVHVHMRLYVCVCQRTCVCARVSVCRTVVLQQDITEFSAGQGAAHVLEGEVVGALQLKAEEGVCVCVCVFVCVWAFECVGV